MIATETDSDEKYSVNQTIIVNITNINDNDPVFNESQYNFTVAEGAAVGAVLGTISVRHVARGSCVYSDSSNCE